MNLIDERQKLFDEKFVQFENNLPVGGFEQAPYLRIKQFLAESIELTAKSVAADAKKEILRIADNHGKASCDYSADCDVAIDDVLYEIQQIESKYLTKN